MCATCMAQLHRDHEQLPGDASVRNRTESRLDRQAYYQVCLYVLLHILMTILPVLQLWVASVLQYGAPACECRRNGDWREEAGI